MGEMTIFSTNGPGTTVTTLEEKNLYAFLTLYQKINSICMIDSNVKRTYEVFRKQENTFETLRDKQVS